MTRAVKLTDAQRRELYAVARGDPARFHGKRTRRVLQRKGLVTAKAGWHETLPGGAVARPTIWTLTDDGAALIRQAENSGST